MLKYVKGDVTLLSQRKPGENVIIPHVCNNVGAWGAGFVLALSKKWPEPEIAYRDLPGYSLGMLQLVKVADGVHVANMIAQVLEYNRGPNIRYDALSECMVSVALQAQHLGASLHCPRFGAGLAGGDWSVIEGLIQSIWATVDVYVYDFVPSR